MSCRCTSWQCFDSYFIVSPSTLCETFVAVAYEPDWCRVSGNDTLTLIFPPVTALPHPPSLLQFSHNIASLPVFLPQYRSSGHFCSPTLRSVILPSTFHSVRIQNIRGVYHYRIYASVHKINHHCVQWKLLYTKIAVLLLYVSFSVF